MHPDCFLLHKLIRIASSLLTKANHTDLKDYLWMKIISQIECKICYSLEWPLKRKCELSNYFFYNFNKYYWLIILLGNIYLINIIRSISTKNPNLFVFFTIWSKSFNFNNKVLIWSICCNFIHDPNPIWETSITRWHGMSPRILKYFEWTPHARVKNKK